MGNTNWIQKMSICYGGRISNSSIRDYIALHFDLVDCDYGGTSTYQSYWVNLKSRASGYGRSIKAIAYFDAIAIIEAHYYWSTFNANEDNFLHTTVGANRIERTTYPNQYLCNPDSNDNGWYDAYATVISNYYSDLGTNIDGIFADDCVGLYLSDYNFDSSPSSWGDGFNYATTGYSTWLGWMETFADHQKDTIRALDADGIFMANCFTEANTIGIQAGSSFYEHFVHTRTSAYNTGYKTASAIKSSIDILYDVLADNSNNTIGGGSGCGSGTTDQIKECAKFVYACLAFAVYNNTSKVYINWNFMGTSPTSVTTYFSWWDDLSEVSTTGTGESVLGDPDETGSGRLHQISSYVYWRSFANYIVVSNLNEWGTSVSFTLNEISYTLSGKHALFIPKNYTPTNNDPIASFTWSPTNPMTTQNVTFDVE